MLCANTSELTSGRSSGEWQQELVPQEAKNWSSANNYPPDLIQSKHVYGSKNRINSKQNSPHAIHTKKIEITINLDNLVYDSKNPTNPGLQHRLSDTNINLTQNDISSLGNMQQWYSFYYQDYLSILLYLFKIMYTSIFLKYIFKISFLKKIHFKEKWCCRFVSTCVIYMAHNLLSAICYFVVSLILPGQILIFGGENEEHASKKQKLDDKTVKDMYKDVKEDMTSIKDSLTALTKGIRKINIKSGEQSKDIDDLKKDGDRNKINIDNFKKVVQSTRQDLKRAKCDIQKIKRERCRRVIGWTPSGEPKDFGKQFETYLKKYTLAIPQLKDFNAKYLLFFPSKNGKAPTKVVPIGGKGYSKIIYFDWIADKISEKSGQNREGRWNFAWLEDRPIPFVEEDKNLTYLAQSDIELMDQLLESVNTTEGLDYQSLAYFVDTDALNVTFINEDESDAMQD